MGAQGVGYQWDDAAVEAAIGIAKDAFGRVRPYGVDDKLPTCAKLDRAKHHATADRGALATDVSLAAILRGEAPS